MTSNLRDKRGEEKKNTPRTPEFKILSKANTNYWKKCEKFMFNKCKNQEI
jgi:hypothetical protein